jgi:Protein of unknown function (DUF2950)
VIHMPTSRDSRMEKNTMFRKMSIFVGDGGKVRFTALVLCALWLMFPFKPTFAQQTGQRTFTSAQKAGHALFAAAQAQGQHALLSILGPDGKELLSSGDPAEDMNARETFLSKYEEMHRFEKEPNGTVTLIIGAENWPFPIPLVNNQGSWYFDTPAGKDEIIFRRIGKNEIAAIEACRDLVEAQQQYLQHLPADRKHFAQKLMSDEGRHNGLYWQGTDDDLESPINPLIAHASGKGPGDQGADPVPFNGYLFRPLTSQGPDAPGGAKNYLVDGEMTRGFAFVAYPAEYRSSGVMTFIVNESGIVYEKDLGPNTTQLAQTMTSYSPDSTWRQADEPNEASQ